MNKKKPLELYVHIPFCEMCIRDRNAVCKILEHYKEIQNENAVRTWVYRIIVNESLRLLKEKKRQDWLKNNTDGEGVYEERRFDVQDDLYEQINNLDTETQTIIKLRFYEDLTLKEIAEIKMCIRDSVPERPAAQGWDFLLPKM